MQDDNISTSQINTKIDASSKFLLDPEKRLVAKPNTKVLSRSKPSSPKGSYTNLILNNIPEDSEDSSRIGLRRDAVIVDQSQMFMSLRGSPVPQEDLKYTQLEMSSRRDFDQTSVFSHRGKNQQEDMDNVESPNVSMMMEKK